MTPMQTPESASRPWTIHYLVVIVNLFCCSVTIRCHSLPGSRPAAVLFTGETMGPGTQSSDVEKGQPLCRKNLSVVVALPQFQGSPKFHPQIRSAATFKFGIGDQNATLLPQI